MLTATGILSESGREREMNSEIFWFLSASVAETVRCVFTCHKENRVVHTEGTVLPALPFPVHHDLHDFCPQRDVGGVDGHAGG